MDVPGKRIFKDEEFYTDWMPRGGDGFILRGQMIEMTGTTLAVSVEVETKNSDDTSNPTTSIKTLTLNNAGGNAIQQALFEPPTGAGSTGVKELVRLKVSTSSGSAGDWMLCRTFPFVWFEGAQ